MSASGFTQVDLLRIARQFHSRCCFPKISTYEYYSRRMVIGTPSEVHDPEFLTDSSDAILLKELKSIIQEHSTHRLSFVLRAIDRA